MSLYSEYKKTLKLVAVEEVFDLFFYRPLAFLFVKVIYHTSLTPNQVTLLSILFGVAAGIIVGFGNSSLFVYAALLFMIYNILDCSDGQLARLKNNGSEIGRLLDGFGDYIVSIFAYFGIGFGFASLTDEPLLYWLLTAAAGASNAVQASLVDYHRNRYLDYAFDREALLEDSYNYFVKENDRMKKEGGHYFERFVIWTFFVYSKAQIIFSKSDSKKVEKKFEVKDFQKRNKVLMHFWTYLGPTTQWTLLIIFLLLNRIDLYLWTLVILGNLLTAVLTFIQKRVNRSTKSAPVL